VNWRLSLGQLIYHEDQDDHQMLGNSERTIIGRGKARESRIVSENLLSCGYGCLVQRLVYWFRSPANNAFLAPEWVFSFLCNSAGFIGRVNCVSLLIVIPLRCCIHHGVQPGCSWLDGTTLPGLPVYWSPCLAKSPKPVAGWRGQTKMPTSRAVAT